MITTNDILQRKVSIYRHYGDYVPVSITLLEVLKSFSGDIYKDRIQQLRNSNQEEYSIKKRSLPGVTFCGEFKNGRTKNHLLNYTKILVLDIDKVDDLELDRIKRIFDDDSYILTFWDSPSGHGIKALAVLEYVNDIADEHIAHKCAFQQISSYLKEKYDIELDVSGSDITRLCFVCFDPIINIKPNIEYFTVDIIEPFTKLVLKTTGKISKRSKSTVDNSLFFDKRHKNSEGKNKSADRLEIAKIIKYLNRNQLSITSSYEEWLRVGFAIANSFNCDLGEKYYLELCRLDGAKHDENESKKMLINCYNKSNGHINFATIRYYAKNKGYHKRKSGGEDGT